MINKKLLMIFVAVLVLTPMIAGGAVVKLQTSESGTTSGYNVNSSDNWNTGDEGPLRTVAELEAVVDHNNLQNLLWSVAGHVIDTNLDMNDYDIREIDKTYFSGSDFISSDDNGHIDMHADDSVDFHANISTIWNMRLGDNSDGAHSILIFGNGRDSWFYYNESDMLIIPNFVGDGMLYVNNSIVTPRNVSASYFVGDGSYLTGLNETIAEYVNDSYAVENIYNHTQVQDRRGFNYTFEDLKAQGETVLDEELNVSDSINIIGSYILKWWDNAASESYAYLTANTQEFKISAIDNPMNFYYGSVGSKLGASMNETNGDWDFTNNVNVTGNFSLTGVSSLINLPVIFIPECNSLTNGSIGRNDSGVYGCTLDSEWELIY